MRINKWSLTIASEDRNANRTFHRILELQARKNLTFILVIFGGLALAQTSHYVFSLEANPVEMIYTIFLFVMWIALFVLSKRWPETLTPGIIGMYVLNAVAVIYAEIQMKTKKFQENEIMLPQQPMLMLMYVFIILIYNTNFVMTQYVLPPMALGFSYFSLAIYYDCYTS